MLFISSCREEPVTSNDEILAQYLNLPQSPYNYQALDVPVHLDKTFIYKQDNTPSDNPTTNEGATLGRVLFYDKILSKNNTIACASCHKQANAFSDTAQFSMGHLGGQTKRHSMGLSNARFRASHLFFWDGRASSIEEQVLMPIQDQVEMGLTLEELVSKIKAQPYYPILFERAYGSTEINSDKIAEALAQFIRSLLSFESKYDDGRVDHEQNEDFSNFTAQENLGKALFFDVKKGNCGGCHLTEAFVADFPRNNGLDAWESSQGNDVGYESVTKDPQDKGKFIPPSLRNIGIRPPYMHDGRFKTLMEVVNHYSDNIQWSNTLDVHLIGEPGTAKRFNLTPTEKDALVAFMHTLTDQNFISNKKFSNPFK